MRRVLEEGGQIEMVLYSHKAPGRVLGGVVTPRWVRFEVLPALGARISSIVRLSEEMALRLGSAGVRVRRQGDRLHVEVPREDGEVVRLLPLAARLREIPRQAALLGLDEEGAPLLLRLPSPEVGHILVAGTTGSGKTALLRRYAGQPGVTQPAAGRADGGDRSQGRGYAALADLPHLLCPVVGEVHQAAYVLNEPVSMMLQRDRERIQERGWWWPSTKWPTWWWRVAGGGAQHHRLTQRGREAGCT
jgi:S-DNA-T family DNA segregation ATPase FtsK/SpoIIIE